MAVEDSFAPLHPMLLPGEVHEQGVGCLQTIPHIRTVIVVTIEPLPRLIPAHRQCQCCPRLPTCNLIEGMLAYAQNSLLEC